VVSRDHTLLSINLLAGACWNLFIVELLGVLTADITTPQGVKSTDGCLKELKS